MNILGISGSLRADSYNTKLIELASSVSGVEANISPFRLNEIPLFSEDLEAQGDPENVHDLKEAIVRADALLIATPEYNSSIPGALKNALDWASRKHGDFRPLRDKPVAIFGASTGKLGTALAQKHLRQILSHVGAQVLTSPSIHVMQAADVFRDPHGDAIDDLRRRVRTLVAALAQWQQRLYQMAI